MIKSKRFSTMIMATLITVSLVGCGSEAASVPSSASSTEPTAEATAESTSQPTVQPSTEPAAEATATTDSTTESTADPATDMKPLPRVDYSGNVTDWMYDPGSENDLVNLLVSIDSVAHGASGASLQEANAAVCLMKLSMEDHDQAVNAATTYLSGMSDTQKDYFSFQWQQALQLADHLLDGSEDAAILEDSGNHDFDLSSVDSVNVTALDQAVTDLLRNAGVTDEWKNQTDNDFFQAAP